MIFEVLLNIIAAPFLFLFSAIPEINFNIPANIGLQLNNLFLMLKYFIPFSTVIQILSLSFAITNWRIIWNIANRIWDALPFT